MPKGQHIIDGAYVTQEHALFCHGQFVSQGKNIFFKSKAWGEQTFDEEKLSHKSLSTALEGAKSNALMRCCKDIGIASELWDPIYIEGMK
jgi:hypothetical protein